jgi:NTE family protein
VLQPAVLGADDSTVSQVTHGLEPAPVPGTGRGVGLGVLGPLAGSALATLRHKTPHAPPVPTRPACVFVLSGGAALGAAQAGMLEVLLEAGLVPDALVGSSAGALNAAFLAQDPTPDGARRIQDTWRRLSTDQMFGSLASWGPNLLRGRSGVCTNHALGRLVDDGLDYSRIEDAPIPLHIGTTHLASRTPVFHTRGPARDVLLASSAIPGVYPAVRLPADEHGRYAGKHMDGGVTDLVPAGYALDLEPAAVWVLDVAGAARHTVAYHPATLDLVSTGFSLALSTQAREMARAVADPRVHAITLQMRFGARARSLLDFSATSTLIDLGRAAAEEAVARLWV